MLTDDGPLTLDQASAVCELSRNTVIGAMEAYRTGGWNAAPAQDAANLSPRVNTDPINIALKPVSGEGKGFVVARNLGLIDSLEVSLFKLKPQTVYSVYVSGQNAPVASFKTNAAGAANGTAIGPLREVSSALSSQNASSSRIVVMEGEAPADAGSAVLTSAL